MNWRPRPPACRRSIEAHRHDDFRRADGHGRCTVPLLHRLPAAGLDLRTRLRRQLHRHAADRRHHELGRPADRRHPARHAAAGRHRHHFVGRQSADRRLVSWSASSSSRRTALSVSSTPIFGASPTNSSAAAMSRRNRRRPCHEKCFGMRTRFSKSTVSASGSAALWRSTRSRCRFPPANGSA